VLLPIACLEKLDARAPRVGVFVTISTPDVLGEAGRQLNRALARVGFIDLM